MITGQIELEEVVGTNLISDNPAICFISPLYSKGFIVNNNGKKSKLEDSIDYISLIETSSYKALKMWIIVRSVLFVIVMSLFLSLIGTVINIGPGFLPKEPGYWKYMVLQFSILSAFLFGFANLFEIMFFNKPWTQRCILNEVVMTSGKEEKCDFYAAKKDLKNLFAGCHVSIINNREFPFEFDYFKMISKALNDFSYKTNLVLEYKRLLSQISGSGNIIKCVASLLVGMGIEVFSFVDLYSELISFRNNMILSVILITLLSIALAYYYTNNKYEKAYIKLDALLYLYSYIFLDMPIVTDNEKCLIIELNEETNINNFDAMIQYEISELEKKLNQHIYCRLVFTDAKCMKVYGIKGNDSI